MASLELLNVRKAYGDILVLDDVSLSMEEREFVAFLGPSGCGKTTLLRLIAGLETVDSGEIHIGDRRVDTLAPGSRGVALVFQNYALYPHMTVADNMAFGLKNTGVKADEIARRVEEAARILELDALLARKPGALRNGAPFKDWDLPPGLAEVRVRLKSHADGDRQFVKVLGAVLDHGLDAVETACAEALAAGIASGDVILTVLARQRQPAAPPSITTPDALRLKIEPMADCGRYDSIRKVA